MKKRGLAGLMAALLLLSGCSLGDMDSNLRAPRPSGEQQKIQQALDTYLSRAGESVQYILKYPQDGEYLSAFVMEDIDGDASEEAIAFYQFSGEGEKTHIHLLDEVDGEWQSISDAEGFSADVSGVAFGDLDGDGTQELLTGWSIYNSRDRQLGVYSLAGGKIMTVSDDEYYTKLVVEDFITPGRDDVLLFQVDTAAATAQVLLKSMEKGALVERGRAPVDGYIRSFGGYHVGRLEEGLHGVYIDCTKDADTTITELVYWDGTHLRTPFYNSADNITTLTARQTPIPSLDVDGIGDRDSQVEWPHCTRLPGYETVPASDALWLTQWMSWDNAAGSEQRLFAGVVNLPDNYFLQIPDHWLNGADNPWEGTVTAVYDEDEHEMWLYPYVNGKALDAMLSVRAGSDEDSRSGEGERLETVDRAGNRVVFRVEYDPAYGLDLEQVRYMLRPLV